MTLQDAGSESRRLVASWLGGAVLTGLACAVMGVMAGAGSPLPYHMMAGAVVGAFTGAVLLGCALGAPMRAGLRVAVGAVAVACTPVVVLFGLFFVSLEFLLVLAFLFLPSAGAVTGAVVLVWARGASTRIGRVGVRVVAVACVLGGFSLAVGTQVAILQAVGDLTDGTMPIAGILLLPILIIAGTMSGGALMGSIAVASLVTLVFSLALRWIRMPRLGEPRGDGGGDKDGGQVLPSSALER